MSPSRLLRVLVLLGKGDLPPENAEGIDLESVQWGLEYDVISNLKKMGHEVVILEVEQDLLAINKCVDEWKPHVAFNLLEGFGGVALFDQNVISYLEILDVPYTGCNPRGLMVSRNKALAKKVLAYHGISTPIFETFAKTQTITKRPLLTFPVFVKSLTEESSAGISAASIVNDQDELEARVKFIHEKVGSDALAEAYIKGRELYVGIIGNQRLEAFPVWELHFGDEKEPNIATEKLKSDFEYRKKQKIQTGPANLNPALEARAQDMARQSCRVLGVNGYARVDFRLAENGSLYVLEVNANPHIGHYEDFARSAESKGTTYHELLARILSLGMRWEPEKMSAAT